MITTFWPGSSLQGIAKQLCSCWPDQQQVNAMGAPELRIPLQIGHDRSVPLQLKSSALSLELGTQAIVFDCVLPVLAYTAHLAGHRSPLDLRSYRHKVSISLVTPCSLPLFFHRPSMVEVSQMLEAAKGDVYA